MFRLPIIMKFPRKPVNTYHRYLHIRPALLKDSPTSLGQQPVGPENRISYSEFCHRQAEQRLGFSLETIDDGAVSIREMLATADKEAKIQGLTGGEVQIIKEKVYERITEYLDGEGYPSETNEDYKESNVNDLVFTVLIPVISAFKRKTERNLRLRREKTIVAMDGRVGGNQEFAMMDMVGIENRKFVFLVEAKKASVGSAKKQCLLAMKDVGELNGGGAVYGFVTSGEEWQMLRFDGSMFTQTDPFDVLFRDMVKNKQRWMQEGSVIVDCIHATLRSGGFIFK